MGNLSGWMNSEKFSQYDGLPSSRFAHWVIYLTSSGFAYCVIHQPCRSFKPNGHTWLVPKLINNNWTAMSFRGCTWIVIHYMASWYLKKLNNKHDLPANLTCILLEALYNWMYWAQFGAKSFTAHDLRTVCWSYVKQTKPNVHFTVHEKCSLLSSSCLSQQKLYSSIIWVL